MKVDIVWFKRDFRLEDHAPINAVTKDNNNFLGIFVIEPSRLIEKDTDPIHIDWEIKCALELQTRIRELGGEMLILHDEVINVFEKLREEFQISNIYSHEEYQIIYNNTSKIWGIISVFFIIRLISINVIIDQCA